MRCQALLFVDRHFTPYFHAVLRRPALLGGEVSCSQWTNLCTWVELGAISSAIVVQGQLPPPAGVSQLFRKVHVRETFQLQAGEHTSECICLLTYIILVSKNW